MRIRFQNQIVISWFKKGEHRGTFLLHLFIYFITRKTNIYYCITFSISRLSNSSSFPISAQAFALPRQRTALSGYLTSCSLHP